jgi:alpha-tubulin suppressor-like RCC1 family protein
VAVTRQGKLFAWGNNAVGQVGASTSGSSIEYLPVRLIPTSDSWHPAVAGGYHTLGVKKHVDNGIASFSLWAWGSNASGQLGDGSVTDQVAPVEITSALMNAATLPDGGITIATGAQHTVAVNPNGELWAWGNNFWGQVGPLGVASFPTPIRLDAATNWALPAAGFGHTVAIKTDGSLWTWGRNDRGQLGNGTTIDRDIPGQIGLGASWSSASTFGDHTVAVRADGTLWAWGANDSGQLGDGSAWVDTPVEVAAP